MSNVNSNGFYVEFSFSFLAFCCTFIFLANIKLYYFLSEGIYYEYTFFSYYGKIDKVHTPKQ